MLSWSYPMNPTRMQVVALLIHHQGRFLLGKRSHTGSPASGHWCAISGGIEPGEHEEATVVREADEEVGLRVRPVRKVGTLDTPDGRITLHWWLVEVLEGEAWLKNDEHTELRWVTPDELRELKPLFPENLPFFARALQPPPTI